MHCKSILFATFSVALLCSVARSDVLVDNMEGTKQNQSTSGGYWFLMVDNTSHETANTRLIFPENLNFAFAENGFESKRSARVCAVLGTGYRAPFAGMGLNLDPNKKWYDWRKVKAVEFRARGKGVWNLKLRDSWNYHQTPNHMNYFWTFSVDSTWRCISLSPKNLRVPDRSPAQRGKRKWMSVADSIGALIFVSSSYRAEDALTEVELQVDDIVIRGIDKTGWSAGNAPKRCRPDHRTPVELQDVEGPDLFDDEGIIDEFED